MTADGRGMRSRRCRAGGVVAAGLAIVLALGAGPPTLRSRRNRAQPAIRVYWTLVLGNNTPGGGLRTRSFFTEGASQAVYRTREAALADRAYYNAHKPRSVDRYVLVKVTVTEQIDEPFHP